MSTGANEQSADIVIDCDWDWGDEQEDPTQEIPPELLPALVAGSTVADALQRLAVLQEQPPPDVPTREIPAAVLVPLVEASTRD